MVSDGSVMVMNYDKREWNDFPKKALSYDEGLPVYKCTHNNPTIINSYHMKLIISLRRKENLRKIQRNINQ